MSFVTRVGPAELAASSAACPWSVRARRGQRLNLTVHFASLAGAGSSLCGLVIDVVDGDRTTTVKPPCGADRHRERQTYTSTGNELKVYVRSTGGATYAAAAASAAAAFGNDDDDDEDDDDENLSSTTSAGFLLHYRGLLSCAHLVACFIFIDFSEDVTPLYYRSEYLSLPTS